MRNNLRTLLSDQLNEIMVSEILILDVMPTIESKISNTRLCRSIRAFKRLIRIQSRYLQKIVRELNVSSELVRPEEFELLMAELVYLTEYSCEPEVVDMNIAEGLSKLNSFQSACYGAASIYASTLGYDQEAKCLQQLIDNKNKCLERIQLVAQEAADRTRDN